MEEYAKSIKDLDNIKKCWQWRKVVLTGVESLHQIHWEEKLAVFKYKTRFGNISIDHVKEN